MIIFAGRRRHTRLQGDWSSDVCSSDLDREPHAEEARVAPRGAAPEGRGLRQRLVVAAVTAATVLCGSVAVAATPGTYEGWRSAERRVGAGRMTCGPEESR